METSLQAIASMQHAKKKSTMLPYERRLRQLEEKINQIVIYLSIHHNKSKLNYEDNKEVI